MELVSTSTSSPRRPCRAPEHLKALSNSLHGADLKLSKISECFKQASKDPHGSPERPPRAPKRSPREPQNAVKTISVFTIFGSCLLRGRFFSSSKVLETIWGSTIDLPTIKNKVFASLLSIGSVDPLTRPSFLASSSLHVLISAFPSFKFSIILKLVRRNARSG